MRFDNKWVFRAAGEPAGAHADPDEDPEEGLDALATSLSSDEEEDVGGNEAPDPDEGSEEYEVIGDNLVRWADGTVADFEGNIVEQEPQERTAEPAPAAAIPAPAQDEQTQVWTEAAVEKSVWTDEVEQEIADLYITDPVEAGRKSRELDREARQKIGNLHRWADHQFDQEMAVIAKRLPEIYRAFSSDIQAAKAQLTLEQKQVKGIADYVVKAIAFGKLTEDDLAFQEAVMRSYRGGKGGTTAPKQPTAPRAAQRTAPAPAVARKPNPEAQLSAPGSVRKAASPRRPTPANAGGRDKLAVHYQELYGIPYDDAKDYADRMREHDSLKQQGGVTIHG